MSVTYGSLVLGGDARNAESLGCFVAWLVCNRLLSDYLERVQAPAIARVRMHDYSGPAFLSTALNGELTSDHLNEEGARFTEHYLLSGAFERDYARVEYSGENEWTRFGEVSPLVTQAWREWKGSGPGPVKRAVAKVIQFPGRARS
ncbi:MAG: hypothetical protein KDI19_12070 [Pseudomonadales bacterium]|nr:hypothetical protein [Pseudomonadales bacterium]